MKKIIKLISYISFLIIICILFSACNESYIVSFDTDGGSIVSEQEVKKGELAVLPDAPTKLGYEFIGWYLGDEKWDFANEVSEDIKLVAKWDLIIPTDISIRSSTRQLVVGDSIKLSAIVSPDNAFPNVTWSVDKVDIASIDKDGTLTGLKAGRVVVTATSTVDEEVFAKITISVAKPASEIDFEGYTIRIGYYYNREYELDARLVEVMNPGYNSSLFSRCLATAINEVSEKYNCIIEVAGYPRINDREIDNYIINEYKNDSVDFDVYFVPTNIIPTISQALLNIDDIYSKYGDSTIFEDDLKEFSYKDKLYGWNYSVDQIQNSDYVLALNYDLLKTIGMDNDFEPAKLFMEDKWSVDEFSEWCLLAQAKLDELATSTGQQYYVLTGHIAYYLQGLANASGIPLADVSNLSTNLAVNDVVDLNYVLYDLYVSRCFDPANQEGRRIDTWNEGRALICVGQAGFVNNMEKWGPNLWGEGTTHYGFVPWPYANGANHQTAKWMSYTTECFCIPKSINQKIKNTAYSSDVKVENIYKVLMECFKRAYELLQSDPTYDKDEYNRFIAQGKWDSEASVNAWLYIQDNLNTKKIFDPIQELKDGSMYTWQKALAGIYGVTNIYTGDNDYIEAVYPYLERIKELIQDRYN